MLLDSLRLVVAGQCALRCLLFAASCIDVCCVLFACCCLLVVAYCSLLIVVCCWLLIVVDCWLLLIVVCC